MRENCTSGLMSGERKRSALERAPPRLSSTLLKRQKNDAADAEAICEAVTRANMRFVPTKTPEQQSGLVLHRTRHLFIRQQTAVINANQGPSCRVRDRCTGRASRCRGIA